MKCSVAKRLLSPYLDDSVSGKELTQLMRHLERCVECATRLAGLQRLKRAAGSLHRKAVPADLDLRLRVALSQAMAEKQRSRWETLRVRWENAFNAVMVPATAGVVTTLIIFGLLISFLYNPVQLTEANENDVPTMLYTPPELQFAPFEMGVGASADSLVVEAYVGADGRVQDYRILSAPENAQQILPQLKNMLIFTSFRPATSFGLPTAGRVVLSFSKVQVQG
jgi:Putative zinc-finger